MYRIFVNDLEFYGFHGVSDEEQQVGHRYSVSLELLVEGNAPESDEISETVDYGEVAATIVDYATAVQRRTMERLAFEIGEVVIQNFPEVAELTIKLEKLLPPAPIIARSAGVELTMER